MSPPPRSLQTTVLVMEPHTQGHHGPYLEWIVEALTERDFKVTLQTLPESLQHPSLQHILSAFPKFVEVAIPDSRNRVRMHHRSIADLTRRELGYWRMFRAWYQKQAAREQPSVVLLPYLDYCLYAIGLLGSPFSNTPWAGIAMRPSFHYREMGIVAPRPSFAVVKKTLFSRMLTNKYLKCLLTIDEPLVEYLRNLSVVAEKVTFLPEPCDLGILLDTGEAKKKLGIDSDRKLILVYGSLTSRKGVAELLRAIADPACPELVDVLLAGNIEEDTRALLGEQWVQVLIKEQRIIVIDRIMTKEDEPILFSGADIVWLGYLGHYTASRVLAQAARAGRPVIACEDGILGWQTRCHNLGVIVRPNEISSVVLGIRTLVANEEMCHTCGINGEGAFAEYSFDRAKKILSRAVGQQASPGGS